MVVDGFVQATTGGPHNHTPHKDKIEKFMRRSEMFDDIKDDKDDVNMVDFLTETDDENALMLEGVLAYASPN